MAPIVNSRKRTRSENGHYFETQSKQFISEQIAASNDANKMKEIHGKFNMECRKTYVHSWKITIYF